MNFDDPKISRAAIERFIECMGGWEYCKNALHVGEESKPHAWDLRLCMYCLQPFATSWRAAESHSWRLVDDFDPVGTCDDCKQPIGLVGRPAYDLMRTVAAANLRSLLMLVTKLDPTTSFNLKPS